MNKIIERNIKKKANEAEERFRREFDQFLNRYGLPSFIRIKGLEGCFKKEGDKDDEWRKRLSQIFIDKETEEMLNRLNYMQEYFHGDQ